MTRQYEADMHHFLAGAWRQKPRSIPVTNPYSGQVLDTVPQGDADDVDAALSTLESGARTMRQMTAYNRSQILKRAADIMYSRVEELARTISSEEGKILAESRVEAK